MASAQDQRIRANCKVIWGNDNDYDFEVGTDDHVTYTCLVRLDFGDAYGPTLTMTSACHSSDAAWAELDRMLEMWAAQVKRGTPMTKDEIVSIFGGPEGEYKRLVSEFMDTLKTREGERKA